MTKYVARATNVLHPGIHKIGTIEDDGMPHALEELPLAQRIEIEMSGGPQDECFLIRYTHDGGFAGDTWHENLDDAFEAAEYEYGLTEVEFERVDD